MRFVLRDGVEVPAVGFQLERNSDPRMVGVGDTISLEAPGGRWVLAPSVAPDGLPIVIIQRVMDGEETVLEETRIPDTRVIDKTPLIQRKENR
jgi:hypothetical protein